MKTASRVCGNCGEKIFGDSPKGLCPACVLETGLGSLADETVAGLDSSAVALAKADDPGHPAEVLMDFGDYELLEEIGRGGQGVVYRARQKSLNRTVALKVIGLGQWATQAHLKRFRREAESAANLDHPCIVPIYEVGERGGSCYFSMKFIDGGQLDEVAKRPPISIRNAAELIAKLARTVHYAHEHGILHRDIKPGNILLNAKGEPHLTDFGLARLLETKSTVTHTMDVLGTPSYMAPEQASGHNPATAGLTSATDVYGLGAVFYQLLTDHPPFAGGTTYETVRLVLETEPRQPRLSNPKIDRELSTICLKCLEKDPKRRYSSALALAEDLEHWLKHEPIRAKRSGFFTHSGKWVRRNPSIAALVTLSVALAAGLGVMVWNHKSVVPIPKSVAVLPFENLSNDPDNAYFADGIQEEILTRLASIADLKVISRTSTQQYQSKPTNLREIAKQLGVANILEGSVQKTADQVRVNAQLINAQTDSHLWAETYDRKLTDLFGIESEIAKGIAESLRARLTGREEQALAVKPTNNSEAYDAYHRGRAFEARGTASADAQRKAIDSYERAVQLDPNFALGWARLSHAEALFYFMNFDTTAARRDAAKKALENAQKLQPNSPETLLALGYYQYWVLRDYGLAKTTLGRVRKILPGSSEVPLVLAWVARREGNWDESVAYLEEGLALDPRNPDLVRNAAWSYGRLRQFPAALKLYDRALDVVPNDPELMAFKAGVYQAQGNLQEAAKLLVEANEQSASDAVLEAKLAQLRLERNHGEAILLLQARLVQFRFGSEVEKGRNQVWLALAQRLAGDNVGAKATAEQARNTLEPLYKDQPSNEVVAAALSLARAALGEKNSALEGAERAIMLLPSTKDRMNGPRFEEVLALIQMIFGETSHSIATLTQLLQTPCSSWFYGTPITPALLRLDPFWDPLRADVAFQELCKEKVEKSIAVLPFENLSNDPDNAYFAEGVQEEILTRLASIAELKVISRSSTQRYQSKPRNLSEIAKQLGVANILEGSVQKAADQVRVNVQLINAQTDSHLWAETYDRKLTDIFGVESEIAKGIAEVLQAKLTGREQQALAAKPTNNPEAYDVYLRGLVFQARVDLSMSGLEQRKAIGCFERAVQLDPNFALAWARLSRVDAGLYFAGGDPTAARREAAKRALENAQKLQPNSPETLLALGYYQYWGLRDYESAKTTFGGVSKLLPGSSEVPMALAVIARREGKWDESVAHWEQGLSLDPQNAQVLFETALTYAALRQFPTALKLYDRVLDMVPNNADLMASKAGIYQAQGNLQEAAKLLAEVNAQTSSYPAFRIKITQLRLERNLGEAIRLLQARQHFASEFDKGVNQVLLALMQRLAGDTAGAKVTAEQGRNTLEPLCEDQPDNVRSAGWLSLSYAVLGNEDSALKEAERAIMLLPSTKDRMDGPGYEETLALNQMTFGENSRAISTLTRLLQTPYDSWLYGPYGPAPLTPALLRLDPIWDRLRADPAFQKLCEEKRP
jgi:TolB-like protein/Tfp pilus assembly protein PilF